MEIDFDTACVHFACAACNGTGKLRMSRHDPDPDWCSECSGNKEVAVYIGTWLANLAMAAGSCAAHEDGYARGYHDHACHRGEVIDPHYPDMQDWHPGCGRTASDWGDDGA